MLDPVARPCIRTAFVLYGGILDAVADDGHSVLHRRAVVPRRRRAAVAVDGLVRLLAARAGTYERRAVRPVPPQLPPPAPPATLERPVAAEASAAPTSLQEEIA
jgi:15-cis-phytoene synthase